MTSPLSSPTSDASTYPLLKTGQPGGMARFDRSLYQLELTAANGDKEKVDLGFSGSRVLERLLQVPGEVVSREELMSYAWENRVVSQGSLSQQIYTLRQILGDGRNQIIQTLPRRGYLFNPQYLLEEQPPALPTAVITPEARRAVILELPIDAGTPATPPKPTQPRQSLKGIALATGISLSLLAGLIALGMQLASVLSEPFFTHQRQVGKLDVMYVENTQQQLEALIAQTASVVKELGSLSDRPARLFVNHSPGFYEFHCLQGENANWLKIHKDQIRTVSAGFLRRCLP